MLFCTLPQDEEVKRRRGEFRCEARILFNVADYMRAPKLGEDAELLQLLKLRHLRCHGSKLLPEDFTHTWTWGLLPLQTKAGRRFNFSIMLQHYVNVPLRLPK